MTVFGNLFFPRHTNNHKANLIKSSSLFLLSICFLFLQIFLNFFVLVRPSVLGFSSNISPESIIQLTNTEREKAGVEILKENKVLSEVARQKAADMFAFNYWSHVSPSGRTPWAFFLDVGYKYQYAGENLARDFSDPSSVVRAWMDSPSHRENIINPKYQEIGIAVVDGTLQGVETTLVVQLFGTPYGATLPKSEAPKTAEKPAMVPVERPEGQTQPAVAKLPLSDEVLSKGQETIAVSNPLDISKAMAFVILGILIGIFAVDTFMVSRQRTPRLSSKSLAQMIFLVAVLIASFFIKQGAIL